MIPRYTRPEMAKIWAPETRFRIWFEIEAHAASRHGRAGPDPQERRQGHLGQGLAGQVRHRPHRRHRARGQARRHRLPHAPGRARRARGALRACRPHLLRRSRHLLQRAAGARRRPAARRSRRPAGGAGDSAPSSTSSPRPSAAATASTPSRPPSASSWRRPMPSSRAPGSACVRARAEVATCALSGAVGTFANVDPRVEAYVAGKLGLTPEPISTQVIPRDRHAMYFATLAVIASSLERLAIEVRHLQRTEVLEAEEFFSAGPEGLLRHAAQAQSRALREHHRARPHGAQLLPARHGERGALARARHLALLRRAHDRARRHGDARLRAAPA